MQQEETASLARVVVPETVAEVVNSSRTVQRSAARRSQFKRELRSSLYIYRTVLYVLCERSLRNSVERYLEQLHDDEKQLRHYVCTRPSVNSSSNSASCLNKSQMFVRTLFANSSVNIITRLELSLNIFEHFSGQFMLEDTSSSFAANSRAPLAVCMSNSVCVSFCSAPIDCEPSTPTVRDWWVDF